MNALGIFRSAYALGLVIGGLATVVMADEPDRVVERWGVFELALDGPSGGNPFVDVRFSAVFSNGARSVDVPGFYDGDGVYRVRFSPDTVGAWRYETTSNRWELTGKTGSFAVSPASAGNHGPVRVHNTYHFVDRSGRAIALPGRPGIAIRLTRVGGDG